MTINREALLNKNPIKVGNRLKFKKVIMGLH